MTEDFDLYAEKSQEIANDPRRIGYWFFRALHDRAKNLDDLHLIVTPESRPLWGSFEIAAALLDSIEDPGMLQEAVYADGDPEVCYMRVVREAKEHTFSTPTTMLDDPLLITLVWRPDHGRWMVHGLGDAVHPDRVPRGA
ncbi:hypothetical protein [Arthrobacter globiformis]|uniref:hypothetical protein n=1 Tax=Arthrobacter globiformis TaxID=1665 RepID=UPI002782F0ED|nr:hypothetical protein [Arthrobacter globiformis]MDQ0866484.1 hypothetical protein [Arthrobacter globiformis]